MKSTLSPASYVLVTPAHNEERTIEGTIRSMLSQTVLPQAWVIVSDGSTDRTDEIVRRYARTHGWIQYVRLPEHRDRQFAAKVGAFNAGYEALSGKIFDIVGNLDADITFGPDYMAYLVSQFEDDDALGVAGTPFVEDGDRYDYRFTNIEHVSGACQLFRRSCFEDIGGYRPVKSGGIDWIAVTTARMRGWKTRTFTERVCYHHRKMGAGNSRRLGIFLNRGRKDYTLGNHPLWQLSRAAYQTTRKPYVVGGALLLVGYVLAAISRTERPISTELLTFTRQEQMQRLHRLARRITGSQES